MPPLPLAAALTAFHESCISPKRAHHVSCGGPADAKLTMALPEEPRSNTLDTTNIWETRNPSGNMGVRMPAQRTWESPTSSTTRSSRLVRGRAITSAGSWHRDAAFVMPSDSIWQSKARKHPHAEVRSSLFSINHCDTLVSRWISENGSRLDTAWGDVQKQMIPNIISKWECV